ncbi:MAG: glutamate--tRNA ligase, partial [Thermoplasmata archaeon]|nr:glutamate--tRNA ligase [Thermoplasmata archaeon]
MEELTAPIRKFALQNAVFHNGKADVKAVLGKIIGERPELSSKAKEVQALVASLVNEVNLLGLDAQKAELEKTAPDLLVKEKGTKSRELPELPNVKGNVVMRLAPFPSGPLHIGNARMVILNDEFVKKHNGKL